MPKKSPATKHVVFFSSFFLHHVGGVERYVYELGRRMVRAGYRVTVLSCTTSREIEREVFDGIMVVRVPSLMLQESHYPFPIPSRKFFRLLKELQGQNIQYVITQARFYLLSLYGAWFARRARVPLIHTEHGSSHDASPKQWINFVVRLHDHIIGRYILRSANKVTTVSPSVAAFVRHLGYPDPEIISNGIDTEYFAFRSKKPQAPYVLGYAGRLEASKGVQDMIAAIKQLDRNDIELRIAGSGGFLQQAKMLIGHDKRIRLVGVLDRQEIRKFYQGIDILIFPSRQPEGLPTTILEAFASGVLVVATKIGGVIDLVRHEETGLLFAPANAKAQRQTVERAIEMLGTDEAQTIIQTARTEVEEQYDWDRVAEKFLNLVQRKNEI